MRGAIGFGLLALMGMFAAFGRIDGVLVVVGLGFLVGAALIGLWKPLIKLGIIGGALLLIAQTLGLMGR